MYEILGKINWEERAALLGDSRFRIFGKILGGSSHFNINNVVEMLTKLAENDHGLFLNDCQNALPPPNGLWMETEGVLRRSIHLGGECLKIDFIGCQLVRLPHAKKNGIFNVGADLFVMNERGFGYAGQIGYEIPTTGGTLTPVGFEPPHGLPPDRYSDAFREMLEMTFPFIFALSLLNRPDSSTRRLPSAPGSPPMNEIVFDPRFIGQRKDGN
jgi:hypothetical protein